MNRPLLSSLTLVACCLCSLSACNGPNHAELMAVTDRTLRAHAKDLSATVITAHLEQEIAPGQNVLWCASFQLAWNELVDYGGGEVQLTPHSAVADVLNKHTVTTEHVPSGSYVAMSGLMGDGIVQKIEQRLEETFDGQASPELLDLAESLGPRGVVAYAYLFRALPFRHAFEQRELSGQMPEEDEEGVGSLLGEGESVPSFGIDSYDPTSRAQRRQADQVRILWHELLIEQRATDQDDSQKVEYHPEIVGQEFVVELKTRSDDDRLILAMLAPKPTLGQTIAEVIDRIRQPNTLDAATVESTIEEILGDLEDIGSAEALRTFIYAMQHWSMCAELADSESLNVPVLDFHLTRNFDELSGRYAVCDSPALNDMPIKIARQDIRFLLNESGVVLKSEAIIGLIGDGPARDFSFDRPFLIMLMRKGAAQPYFALWIGNTELLQAQPPAGE